jgi:hypothetical protein
MTWAGLRASSSAAALANPVDEFVGIFAEVERDVLVGESADLVAAHADGAEPLRGGVLQLSGALDLSSLGLRVTWFGRLAPLVACQLSSIRCSIAHGPFVPG